MFQKFLPPPPLAEILNPPLHSLLSIWKLSKNVLKHFTEDARRNECVCVWERSIDFKGEKEREKDRMSVFERKRVIEAGSERETEEKGYECVFGRKV